ncbi:DNA (Cytosine-5)-methyltransferase DRM1/2 isoform 3 [Hibiscus syriacus]|uniref:DNA (Cytosine-5)-methyltransferase DRM1/2 isoform 3 n=1 Tax=Hibiscus syriacus TaxID=106335 RepID=A0A6A3BRM5_HIBSY|nr:DNA (Cytosine-5)-methyltransferase DRM1/2 isoform 3 [Hibiscus syriacus]
MISQILIVLSDTEEIPNSDSDEENKLLFLTKMGYSEVEASIAMERCGPDSSIAELPDFICAAQMAKATDALISKHRKFEKKLLNEDDHAVLFSIPMIGSGVPTEPDQITQRTLPEDAIGAPYFYYEQIHLSNPMIGSAKLTERICKALEAYDNEPPLIVQKYVLDEC